jgi:type IV secretion system protein VirB4
MGGAHHELGATGHEREAALAFQPLRRIDEAATRSWAAEWIAALLNLASAPPEERTLTGLSLLLQSKALRSALQPYTLEGPFGPLLDSAVDRLAIADVHCFEMEALMGQSGAVLPVLTYLFHRLEERFDGRPTLLVLDEAWLFLDNPFFAARIREWLKVLRKKNVSVVFATQSLADISQSGIAPAIIESCPQRIFLANDRAIEPQARAAYEQFGLNARQVELIARAAPKRHYYLQSSRGTRLFELGLGPIALAFCGASDPASQRRIQSLLAEPGSGPFARAWLEALGLSWAAALVGEFGTPLKEGEQQ